LTPVDQERGRREPVALEPPALPRLDRNPQGLVRIVRPRAA